MLLNTFNSNQQFERKQLQKKEYLKIETWKLGENKQF